MYIITLLKCADSGADISLVYSVIVKHLKNQSHRKPKVHKEMRPAQSSNLNMFNWNTHCQCDRCCSCG